MDCSHSTRMYTQKPTHADRRQHKMESGRLDGPMDGWMERHVYTMYVGVRPIHMALGTVWRSTVARAPSAAQGSVGTRDGRGRRTRGRRALAVATWLQHAHTAVPASALALCRAPRGTRAVGRGPVSGDA
jgi:hypothetical protein